MREIAREGGLREDEMEPWRFPLDRSMREREREREMLWEENER